MPPPCRHDAPIQPHGPALSRVGPLLFHLMEQVPAPHAAYPIRAVDRVCDILDALAAAGRPVSLPGVAASAELPKSSTFRYLAALEARRYVERSPGGEYQLGPAFRRQDAHGLPQGQKPAEPVLAALRDELGETTNLGVLDGSEVVHAVVCESPQMMRLAARVGERGLIHATALGKVMCAALPEERVRTMLSQHGMPAMTESTITSAQAYLRELQRVRGQGYGVDDQENQLAGRCVPVPLPGLPVPAGISVSAPASRLPAHEVRRAAQQLQRAATEIVRALRE